MAIKYTNECVCGGHLTLVGGPDRYVISLGKEIVLPETLLMPTCAGCGEEWPNDETNRRIDAFITEVSYASTE